MQTADGGYIAAGAVYQQFGGGYSILLVKTDSMGNENWSQFFGESGDWSEGYSVKQTLDGGYLIGGYTGGWWTSDLFLIKTDADGELMWSLVYGYQNKGDVSYSVIEATDSIVGSVEFVASGVCKDTLCWLLRIGEVESIVDEDSSLLPNIFGIYEIYPNPFNSSTKISYSLESLGDIKISIFNIAGQRVFETNIMRQEPGRYAIQWDDSGLSSGVYVVKLTQGENTDSKRMLLLK